MGVLVRRCEETSADHFMLLLLMETDKLPDPEKVEALGELLREREGKARPSRTISAYV